MLAKIAPGRNSKSRCSWLKTLTPVTSVGSRSGVNCSRRNEQSIERAHRLGQHGLADAGHVLDQEVSFGDQGDQGQPDLTVLAPHDLLDVGLDLPELGREPLPVLGTLANLHPVTPSRATGP